MYNSKNIVVINTYLPVVDETDYIDYSASNCRTIYFNEMPSYSDFLSSFKDMVGNYSKTLLSIIDSEADMEYFKKEFSSLFNLRKILVINSTQKCKLPVFYLEMRVVQVIQN